MVKKTGCRVWTCIVYVNVLLIAVGVAIVSQEIVAVTLFLLFYVLLRKYAGGYHAESNGKCVWYSSIVIVLVILLNKFVHFYCELEPEVCAAIFLLLFQFTQRIAPVEARNKSMGVKEKRRCKKKILIFGGVHIIVLMLDFLILKQSIITVNLILGYAVLMFILLMGAKTQSKNRRKNIMRRKITASMLVLTMCFSMFIGGIDAKAETLSLHDKSTMEFVEISDEEVMPETIDEITANFDERMYSGSDYSLNNRARAYNSETVSTDNTDPNYALLVTNDTVTQGTIESVGEMRWYGFQVTERSKVTVLLQMVESLDADLYLFELNQETYVLDLVDGSAQEGVGLYEYYNNVLDSGIYYLAVAGYEGIGQYMFAFYQSTNDAVYEVNDSSGNATPVEFGKNFVGVIDNPNDIDYYQIVVTAPTIMQYSITTSDGYSFLYGGSSGNNAAIYNVNSATKTYKFMPGTYYFAVLSENDVYSASSTYTVNFKKIGVMSSDSSLSIVGISEDGGIVYQTNENGTLNYVNGNPVDYSYSYYNEISNSAGTQFYDIEIDTNAGAYVLLMEEYQPTPVHYISSTMPAMNVSSRPALILTYYCDTPFYKIHCRGTGAYSSNTYWDESYYARVLIDPETGKLIDIVEPNYYYHFVPQSGNSITVTGSYSMEFYNN